MKKVPLFIAVTFICIFTWLYMNRVDLPKSSKSNKTNELSSEKAEKRERSILDRNRKSTPKVNRRSLFTISAKVSLVKMVEFVEDEQFVTVVVESQSRERLGNFLDDLINRRAIKDIIDNQLIMKDVHGYRVFQATYKFK